MDYTEKQLKAINTIDENIQIMTIIRESELTGPLPQNINLALEKYEACLVDHCYFDFTMIQSKPLQHLENNNQLKRSCKKITIFNCR
jgi:hypothetical protein